jgi:hypothetical protein
MKNAVFWDVMTCGCCKNDVPEELGASFIRVLQLLVTANVPSSRIPITMMMQAIRSSVTQVLTRVTRRNIPEYRILHSLRL